ncbi:conserved hypothetical protein [Deferribacter desulfuricans SSM1]|uniref:Uncharacterized protein n=1 Tax=Deferribacter desulfuricans (strain DSM 14783 / JCM 11476 / NBRC 101012 / SSM1) TaxID=639282 RepID=D3PC76_DEFDS|nr:ParM/StbA family protein [Deferribacter desulfuricans]BAI80199.1 conserved hypothetical protein [Deferribacter desulfuricans SSM1]
MRKVISIDIGFGSTKVAFNEGSGLRLEKFPTAIAPIPSSNHFNDNFYQEDKHFYFEGQLYTVGDAAKADAIVTTSYEFLHKYSPLILYYIIEKFNIDYSNAVFALGLPLSYYTNDKINEMSNRLKSFTVNDVEISIDVKILVQGVGCLFDYLSTNQSNVKNGIVVDIGYNTIEFIVIQNGKVKKADSRGLVKKGMNMLIVKLQQEIQSKYALELTEHEAVSALEDESINLYGNKIPLKEDIIKLKKWYTDTVIQNLIGMYDDKNKEI